MRNLAIISFSFAFGICFMAYLPFGTWPLWVSGILLCIAVFVTFPKKYTYFRRHKRMRLHLMLSLFSFAAALLYFSGYRMLIQQPVLAHCGGEDYFCGTVCEYPMESTYGAKVTIELDGYRHAKAIYYGDGNLLDLEPGQVISGKATWNDSSHIHDDDVMTFTSRGVYALLYSKGGLQIANGRSWHYLPQQAAHALKEKIAAIWHDDNSAMSFVTAELTGDKTKIAEEYSIAMSEVGLTHLFAVSGLHCAFLVSLISLLIPARFRRLGCGITIFVLLFYMVMVGLTPSVVRACIMQIFWLIAPLFRRESDGLTSLGAALLVILLCNPFAIASISLQLSFGATLGMILFAHRIYDILQGWYHGERRICKRTLAFVAANVGVTLSAMLITAPLTAYYFGTLALLSPIASLFAVPVAGWNFMISFLTVLLGFVNLPAAVFVSAISKYCCHFVLGMAHILMRIPYHAVYFTNHTLYYWLGGVYAALAVCLVTKCRFFWYLLSGVAAIIALIVLVHCNIAQYHADSFNMMSFDVGEGAGTAFYDDQGHAVLVDCGSSKSYVDAGKHVADQLLSMGISQLDGIILTHFHADHTSGLVEIMTRLSVNQIYLPDIEDEDGVKDKIFTYAENNGIDINIVCTKTVLNWDKSKITIYPPLGRGDMNEQGLSLLCSQGSFDCLVTGDMNERTEQYLLETYLLPDLEVLMVGHHGSKYSTGEQLLQATKPEIAVISTGDNSYGHPTQEVIDRLNKAGAAIYRTDEYGDLYITAHEGVQ